MHYRTPLQQHYHDWNNCQACELSQGRTRMVFCRGSVPADVLFIGEAPGESEDVIGLPFIGPAGKLLDKIVSDSLPIGMRYAMTNLVCCFPKEQKETKDHSPPQEAIEACSLRLSEFVQLVRPRLIVLVGKLSDKHIEREHSTPWLKKGKTMEFITIAHPASILRANIASQGLAVKRCIVDISHGIERMLKP